MIIIIIIIIISSSSSSSSINTCVSPCPQGPPQNGRMAACQQNVRMVACSCCSRLQTLAGSGCPPVWWSLCLVFILAHLVATALVLLMHNGWLAICIR
jgi:hypothetical protein